MFLIITVHVKVQRYLITRLWPFTLAYGDSAHRVSTHCVPRKRVSRHAIVPRIGEIIFHLCGPTGGTMYLLISDINVPVNLLATREFQRNDMSGTMISPHPEPCRRLSLRYRRDDNSRHVNLTRKSSQKCLLGARAIDIFALSLTMI